MALLSPDGIFTSADAGLRGPLVRHHLAVLAREEGRGDEAERHWQAALTESPFYQPARVGLAELYLHQARWPELETLLAELERQPQTALEAAVLRARAHLARRDFAAARQLLDEVIRQAPQALEPRIVLSHVLLQSGEESAAESLLRHIVGRDPVQAESWRNLAVLFRRRGRLREAIATAQAGRLHCPRDGELTLLHALLLGEGGDRINAETCLLQLLEADSGSDGPARQRRATARHHLAGIYRDLGRVREAEAHLSAVAREASNGSAGPNGVRHSAGYTRSPAQPEATDGAHYGPSERAVLRRWGAPASNIHEKE
jgi:tetratricopeptide (TPR) repeat protein